MTNKQEVLQNCTVEGNIVKLPAGQLERKLYQEVAKSLELIGGKWKGNKVMGFVFQSDPTDLLEQIAGGEKRNLKKEFQFFATPADLADELVFQAQIEPWHRILEPSAGQGAIIEAVFRTGLDMKDVVDYCELMDVNRTILEKKIDSGIIKAQFVCEDFTEFSNKNNPVKYDRVIANPPFQKNQDILHIRKMYDMLAPHGRLVSIASKHWQLSQNKVETEFREWLHELKADIEEIPAGKFKESGTAIASTLIIINKK